MSTARISVIMGIYNCASTLGEALDSLYAQTFQDFKIILCEDGSTDNTYEVAQRYASQHDSIILIKNEKNMGLNYTLNRCLELADTEYIARMDGDDISLPTRFEKEINFLDTHPEYSFVSTPMIYFDSDGIYRTSKKGGEPSPLDFLYGKSFCHAPLLIRSSAIIDVGGYTVSPYLLRVEDRHLWYKLYMKNYKGNNLNEPLYMMRDDRNAKRRRTFLNRRNEAYMRLLYCKGFNLSWWHYPESIIVPLIKWLMPNWLYNLLHRART
ncbi:MAG: glycosyltransferase [Muribaculaceae bacterium]|nr:glycosyltransferase [Muribaculaceae bacterium]